jgi:hypothetical protein
MASRRHALALLVAVILAAMPMLSVLTTAHAAGSHAAMAVDGDESEHGCCPEQDSSAAAACYSHCAAGTMDSSTVVVLAEASPGLTAGERGFMPRIRLRSCHAAGRLMEISCEASDRFGCIAADCRAVRVGGG